MTLTTDGSTMFYTLLAIAGLVLLLALWRRTWSLWLLALGVTVLALVVASTHRADVAVARATGVFR